MASAAGADQEGTAYVCNTTTGTCSASPAMALSADINVARCAKLLFECGPAIYSKNPARILACTTVKDLCGCLNSLPFDIGKWIQSHLCTASSDTVAAAPMNLLGMPVVANAVVGGTPTCPPGYDLIPPTPLADKCWLHSCKAGYSLIDTDNWNDAQRCWANCPDGWSDGKTSCSVSLDTFGKGCCCTVFGCCHNCPPSYTDNGCTCGRSKKFMNKDSYLRDFVSPTYS